MIAIICPGAMSYDAASPDQTFRDLTLFFGLYSMNTFFNDPEAGTLIDTVNRRGRGRPGGFCQRSGNHFPQERLRIDGDGRLVGDLFYTTGSPQPLTTDIDEWPGDY